MGTIADIFREHGPEYLETYQESIPSNHRKVMGAIIGCRTEAYGVNIYGCEQCNKSTVVFRSCGNRHCPTCQNHKTRQWLERQLNRELPGHHFMVTFTVPRQLRRFMRSHQRIAYAAFFAASSAALKKLSADEKFVGGDCPGFFGVLHTWGDNWNIIPIFIISFPAALSIKKTAIGTLRALIFMSRYQPCQRSFAPNSRMR